MTVPTIALKVNSKQYNKLVNLGNRVIAEMTGNLNFSTPVPALATLQTAVTAVENAIAAWGPVGNRGSQADYDNLLAQSVTLHNMLKAEADYVQTTAVVAAVNDYLEMASIMTSSGFTLKSAKHSQGPLNHVEDLKFMSSNALNKNQVKIVWKQPNGLTSKSNVNCYNIYRSLTTNFADAVFISSGRKQEYIDTNNTGATVTWSYFVAAVGAAGVGAVSGPITVTLLPS